MKNSLKVSYKKLNNGKTLRVSTTSIEALISEKLSNEKILEKHESQLDIYIKENQEIIDRKYLHYNDALKLGREIITDFPELGYRITQIVE